MAETVDVVVVGAGQAGLAVSHELTAAGVEHVILERGRVAQTWRDRWDSFCLVTPNSTVRLPGDGAYAGDDPEGFMPRDEIVRHFERWADAFRAPVRGGVDVTSLERSEGRFTLETSDGVLHARSVVVCTGAYQRPHRPAVPPTPGVLELDAEAYTNEAGLPPGTVVVVGSGQTGCQLAEELCAAGRDVVLACGRAPWAPRRLNGRDTIHWIYDAGFYDQPASELPSPEARLVANVQLSGRDGGHDLNYRTLRAAGVTLAGHFRGAADGSLHFAADLGESVAFGDARYAETRTLIVDYCRRIGIEPPELSDPPSFDGSAPERLELNEVGAILYTCGFRPDYASWVKVGAFDELGFPIHADGASTTAAGLYFCGVHFLRKRKSSLLMGVGEDAAIVAESIAVSARR